MNSDQLYVQVALLHSHRHCFWYQAHSDQAPSALTPGTIVQVPLRNRVVHGVVFTTQSQKPNIAGAIRFIHALETLPADVHYQEFITQLAWYYQIHPAVLIDRLSPFFCTADQTTFTADPTAVSLNKLTDQQQEVVDFLAPHIRQPRYTPTVLHGVTGSGKTEVYKHLIYQCIAAQKSAMLLLPEVTLALEFEKKMISAFGDAFLIYSFHSAVALKKRRLLWHHLLAGEPVLIIGVHLPVFLPIANLGIIIVDEEHEVGYQEKKHPKINSKEAAILKSRLHGIPILLGSATPSISTLYNVKKRGWHLFSLKNRFAGSFPTVTTVLLPQSASRQHFWISKELERAISDRLAKKEQVILFLNRRGFSFFLQCTSCGFVARCTRCSVSLTVHEDARLICHYCGYTQTEPTSCPGCKSAHHLLKKGIGTQQLVMILKKMFPTARIARADLDTTTKKELWQKTMNDFAHGALDILVGTQSITKGYDFKGVTLVGAIWADINLNFPLFNASETTLQQLIQVSGRAGRFTANSHVIMQAMENHPIFSYLNEIDYLAFFEHEFATRSELDYPPCARLVEIELKSLNETVVEKESHECAIALATYATRHALAVQVLGPAKPVVHQIKKLCSRKIYLKAKRIDDAITLYQETLARMHLKSSLFFTPNPVT